MKRIIAAVFAAGAIGFVGASSAHAGYPSEPGTNRTYTLWQVSGTCPNAYQLTPWGWRKVCA